MKSQNLFRQSFLRNIKLFFPVKILISLGVNHINVYYRETIKAVVKWNHTYLPIQSIEFKVSI